jgi:magnesium transporter
MIEIYKTIDNNLVELKDSEEGSWINVTAPTDEEIKLLKEKFDVETGHLRAVTDEEEQSRVEIENGQTLVIIDIPTIEKEEEVIVYSTIPLGIILTKDVLITVCLEENTVMKDFINNRIKGFYTNFKNRFVFQILYRVAYTYLRYLRHIDKITDRVEKELYKSMNNEELFDLLALEKSMVYFSTSLKSNEMVLEKMLKMEYLKKYPDDMELLEDVIIENKQAIEMTNIYTGILNGTMDAFASIISNNVNNVMKVLTSITILITIPTLVSSMFGMNVSVPFAENPYAFWIVMGISFGICGVLLFFLYRRRMF